MGKSPQAPDGDVGPDLTPRPDFMVWVQPEALHLPSKGFAARAYWVFGSKMNPRAIFRIKLGGVMYRISLRPTSKASWPDRSVMVKHLLLQAAQQARDFGAPQGIGEQDAEDHGSEATDGRRAEEDDSAP